MAKWEHWFWVTIFLLFESRCRGQHHNQGLEFIDTLTAPTLQPRPGEEAVEVSSSGGLFSRPPIEKPRNAGLINRRKDYNEDSQEEKLTIITPSSVVVMSTPATRPRPTTITASVPPTSEEASTQNLETAASQPQDVSVSHSFSVVRISQNVKYSSSSDSSATKSEAEKSESETNKSVEAGEASEQDSLAASLLETASADLQNRFFQKKPLSSTTISPTTTVLSSTLPTATTITSVEKSSKKNTTVTSTKTEAKSEAESEAEISSVVSVASKAKSASEDPHRAPKSIVHPRNPDNRLLLLDRPFHLSATTTQPVIHTSTTTDSHITSSAESTSTVTASPTTTLEAETDTSTIKTNFFEGMKYEHNILENQGQPQQPQQTQRMSGGHHQKTTVVTTEIRPMSKSETARALDELGFEYNEYMDDSDLLGDDNNDEVIPPFHEENYEHDEMVPVQQSRDHSSDYHFSSARAIPSKSGSLSGLGSLVYEDPTHNSLHNSKLEAPAESADVVSATSRQSKKAPLPHHYEPSTIAGITIGAFLLIFIGTVGLGAFIYHERYVNKPHTLDDGFSDSGGCSTSVDDSIGRVSHIDCSGLDITTDTYCEEMYNLDNDSFLNSLETVAMPTMLWSVAPHSDSDV